MKIRNGFVSNSSSCSFCLYGWERGSRSKLDDLHEKIKEAYPNINLICAYGSNDSYVLGVGNYDDGIDHDNENWEEYEADYPTAEEVAQIDEAVKKLNLPKPEYYQDTFRNG